MKDKQRGREESVRDIRSKSNASVEQRLGRSGWMSSVRPEVRDYYTRWTFCYIHAGCYMTTTLLPLCEKYRPQQVI